MFTFGVTSYPTSTFGLKMNGTLAVGPRSDFSSVGLIDTYHGPICLSMIGRSSYVHVSAENSCFAQPISCDKLTPTGQCHDSGTLMRGRMCVPTHWNWPPTGLAMNQ